MKKKIFIKEKDIVIDTTAPDQIVAGETLQFKVRFLNKSHRSIYTKKYKIYIEYNKQRIYLGETGTIVLKPRTQVITQEMSYKVDENAKAEDELFIIIDEE